jgi:hypothetical protein
VNDHPVMPVPYNIRSSLPIAEALRGPEPEPTVNISFLEEDNQNLNAGQKLLLECHLIR